MKHHPNSLNISLPKKVNVTEQEIDISSLSDVQKGFYVDLFKEIVRLYQSKKKLRIIVGVAGPAGSGKSVIVALFCEIAKQLSLPFRFETIGIDAFHYANEFLLTNYSDGKPLKDHKGRFDTYDVEKLTESLRRFSSGDAVSFPKYSRKSHNPIENAIIIEKEEPVLLIIEGLWVLYDKDGWEKIGELLDFSIFVETNKETVRHGVLERHVRGGRTTEEAAKYYEANEAKNFDLIMKTKNRADKIIQTYNNLQ